MAPKKKATCYGWGIFGGKHKRKKVAPLEYFGHPHRKEHLRKEKINETSPILEFLESSLCGMDDTLS
jgi:hypothetical protein